ncbi:TPA: hypothetical protein ACQCWR_001815 [Campylobacter jejuni]
MLSNNYDVDFHKEIQSKLFSSDLQDEACDTGFESFRIELNCSIDDLKSKLLGCGYLDDKDEDIWDFFKLKDSNGDSQYDNYVYSLPSSTRELSSTTFRIKDSNTIIFYDMVQGTEQTCHLISKN